MEPISKQRLLESRSTLLPWLTETMGTAEKHEAQIVGPRSPREEVANSITHGIGLVISLAASWVLVAAAIERGSAWTIIGCGIYSATLVMVYLASTLSHTYRRLKLKRTWRILDQAFIYLLIAGSFTPWGLVYLRHGWTLYVLIAMWIIALGGFISKAFFAHRIDGVATWIYVGLGWIPILAIKPIVEHLPHEGLVWMLAGGLFYTVGVLFLKLDHHVPFFHAIWHKMVIAGSACQWLAVYWYVVG